MKKTADEKQRERDMQHRQEVARARSERINAVVQKAYPGIQTSSRVFEHKDKHLPVPHVWDITYHWNLVPNVTEDVSASFSASGQGCSAIYVSHQPCRRVLDIQDDTEAGGGVTEGDLVRVEQAVLAGLKAQESRRIEDATNRLRAAGLEDLLPMMDEIAHARERTAIQVEGWKELQSRFIGDRKAMDEYVRKFVLDAMAKMDSGMFLYHANLRKSEGGIMLGFDVTLSYPWGG